MQSGFASVNTFVNTCRTPRRGGEGLIRRSGVDRLFQRCSRPAGCGCSRYEKTRLRGSDLETWCPEEDSNLHGVAPAST